MQKNQNDKSYKRAQPSEKQESRIPAEGVRLNRFLSEAGICSRREADRRIADGRVTIDGRVAEVGQKLMPGPVSYTHLIYHVYQHGAQPDVCEGGRRK